MKTMGIDDAGRGPLIGPMILAGTLTDKSQESKLKKTRIADSKTLFHSTRIKLSKLIKENSKYKIVKTNPNEIDKSLKTGTNLNTLEAQKTADIINFLNNTRERIKVIVDCPSINIQAWKNILLKFINHPSNLTIKCEHKADANHLQVAAASILAKVTREEEVAKLKKQYGETGSGYPSDPKTKAFLKANGKKLQDSGIFRKTWSTWKKLYPEKTQSSLADF